MGASSGAGARGCARVRGCSARATASRRGGARTARYPRLWFRGASLPRGGVEQELPRRATLASPLRGAQSLGMSVGAAWSCGGVRARSVALAVELLAGKLPQIDALEAAQIDDDLLAALALPAAEG